VAPDRQLQLLKASSGSEVSMSKSSQSAGSPNGHSNGIKIALLVAGVGLVLGLAIYSIIDRDGESPTPPATNETAVPSPTQPPGLEPSTVPSTVPSTAASSGKRWFWFFFQDDNNSDHTNAGNDDSGDANSGNDDPDDTKDDPDDTKDDPDDTKDDPDDTKDDKSDEDKENGQSSGD
jgi:hypothetical protein